MATVLKVSGDDFEGAMDVLDPLVHSGGLFVYPTDTVYGIGGKADSADVVRRINAIKGSAQSKPLSVMVSDFGMIDEYCDTGIWEDMILKRYLPGPYTFILKLRRPIAASGTDRLGVRMPDSAFCRALCERIGEPVVSTSANLSGRPAPVRFEDIDRKILDSVQVAVDGGPTKYGKASLVLDLVDVETLREGAKGIEIPER
ncbi:MAG: L-threonylcarbamoyladenylate synthase [Candidatus ainarchaeum sp.]|nr:L-threonylcarbamoyladenylate synthase [Candidatus ainarchaeum sp.]